MSTRHKAQSAVAELQPDPSAIRLDAVSKSFGTVQAVKSIDLTISSGEIVAFLGPNGAGKTSTIDIVLGLSQPDSGAVEVFGMSPRRAIDLGLVSAVLQTGGLLPDMTVREIVEFTAALFPVSRPVSDVLERANLTTLANRQIAKCSGGEQQRVRFALALLPDPELIVLDEPTTGMDVEARRQFWAAMRQDAQAGRTIFFATHYLDEADDHADRIILLRDGSVVADGTPGHIKSLVSGRTIRAEWPSSDRQTHLEVLRAIEDVDGIEERGAIVILHARDSDSVVRYLLTQTSARDILITAKGLEEAFMALTVGTVEEA